MLNNTKTTVGLLAVVGLVVAAVSSLTPISTNGQEPEVLFACYIPQSGVVYRVNPPGQPGKYPDLADECKTRSHVLFSWNEEGPQGPPGPKGDPGEKGDQGEQGPPGEGLDLSCAAGEIPKWNGSEWTCGSDEDTKYTAGFGLDLVGGNLEIDGSEVQRRIVASCRSNEWMREVREDGTVVCVAHRAKAPWRLDGEVVTIPIWMEYEEAEASCPPGYMAVSGGFSISENLIVLSSLLVGTNKWYVYVKKTNDDEGEVTAYVNCVW